MKRIRIVALIAYCFVGFHNAQAQQTQPLSFEGYAEVYSQYQAMSPQENARPDFVYSHNRNNEVNLNLALLSARYATEKFRANLGIGFGSYMNANYAAEEGVLKNLYEANMGVRLSENNWWIDMGILPSHIGSESAVSADCATLSRSMMAENSPYFETGIRLSKSSEQWYVAFLLLNGWQRIQRVDGNTTPALGYQVTYSPSERFSLNLSGLMANDQPDVNKKMRYFHDIYSTVQLTDRWNLVATFDFGYEQKQKNSSDYHSWYGTSLVSYFKMNDQWGLGLRGEYYHDPNEVMIATAAQKGFETSGFSANVDYQILPNVQWRIEAKHLNSKEAIFADNNGKGINGNLSFLTSISARF